MIEIGAIRNLEEQLNVDPQDYEYNEKIVQNVLSLLEENEVELDENSFIGFGAHLINLIGRLKAKEEMIDLGTDVLSQIDEESICIAEKVVKALEDEFATDLNQSEMVLIAIHIQTARMK